MWDSRGFGHRMLSKLTGIYSLHYLPMGFAQMVVLDSDFQKRYYKFNFVRREFLGEVQLPGDRCSASGRRKNSTLPGQDLGRRSGLQHCSFQRNVLIPRQKSISSSISTVGA